MTEVVSRSFLSLKSPGGPPIVTVAAIAADPCGQRLELLPDTTGDIPKTWTAAGTRTTACAQRWTSITRRPAAPGRQPSWPPMPYSPTCWPDTPRRYPRYGPTQPGQFYLRELPPLRVVLRRSERAGPAGGRRLRRSGPCGTARPGRACARRVRHPGHRGGQVQVPHGYPRGAGHARILGAPVVRYRGRDAQRRRGSPGPAHDRPAPAARRTAPRRYPRPSMSARRRHDRPPARPTPARDKRRAAGVHPSKSPP